MDVFLHTVWVVVCRSLDHLTGLKGVSHIYGHFEAHPVHPQWHQAFHLQVQSAVVTGEFTFFWDVFISEISQTYLSFVLTSTEVLALSKVLVTFTPGLSSYDTTTYGN